MTQIKLIESIKLTLQNPNVLWVLFSNATFLIIKEELSEEEAEKQAIDVIQSYGPVVAGSSSADFSVSALEHVDGWLVSSHKKGLFTYVSPSEIADTSLSDVEIGLLGRSKRHQDSIEQKIIFSNIPLQGS